MAQTGALARAASRMPVLVAMGSFGTAHNDWRKNTAPKVPLIPDGRFSVKKDATQCHSVTGYKRPSTGLAEISTFLSRITTIIKIAE